MKNIILYSLFMVIFNLGSTASANYIGTLKLINGSFKYSSQELQGSSMSIASPSVGVLKPLDERHQIGASFDVFFSVSSQSVSLYGLGIVYKYILKGLGANSINETSDLSISTITKWDFYLLNTFKRYSYFLGSNKLTQTQFDQNGDFFNYDIGFGASYNIGNNLRAVGEISNTLFSLASSDNRIKFKSTLLTFGVQKEF